MNEPRLQRAFSYSTWGVTPGMGCDVLPLGPLPRGRGARRTASETWSLILLHVQNAHPESVGVLERSHQGNHQRILECSEEARQWTKKESGGWKISRLGASSRGIGPTLLR